MSALSRIVNLFAHHDKAVPDQVISEVIHEVDLLMKDVAYYRERADKADDLEWKLSEATKDLVEIQAALRKRQAEERNLTTIIGKFYLTHNPIEVRQAILATGNSIVYADGTLNKITLIKGLRNLLTSKALPNGLAGTKDAIEQFLTLNESEAFIEILKQRHTQKGIEDLRKKLTDNTE